MNRERIASLLQEPARVAREDLAGLRELKERYPWFSGAHLLLAMGEHASGEVLFDETLLTTAAHVPSREVLWGTIHQPATGVVDVPVPVMPLAPAPPQASPEEQIVATASVATPVATAPEAPVIRTVPAEPPQGTEVAEAKDDRGERELEQQILEAAVAGAYSFEDLEDLPPVVKTPSVPAALPTPTAEEEDLSPRSFLSWLDVAPAASAPTLDFRSGAARQSGEQDWLREPGKSSPRTTDPTAGGPSLTRDVIDRFLEQSTPEPKRTEFFSPQQAGKRSLEEKLDIATETLARIHEKQGHWAKAARIYHQLALKHPEKSGYFAALAKKAEDNLNP